MTDPTDISPYGPRSTGQVSRRGFLRGVGAGGAALAGSAALAACGVKAQKPGAGGTPSAGAATSSGAAVVADPKTVVWSNWPLYIDQDDKNKNKRPSLEAFTKQTGITVKYTEDVNDNTEFFGKVQPQLKAGQGIGRDLIVLTDWMAARMIRLGYVQKLDLAQIPNVRNLNPSLRDVPFDKGRAYSLPWQSGMTGIGYSPKKLGRELKGVEDLFDKRLKGRVTMLTEMRDTMGLILLALGKDPVTHTFSDYKAAIAKLQKAVDAKQIRQFTGNEYAADLAAGNIAAAMGWSGDVIQLQADDPHMAFLIPQDGGILWSDNLMIPVKAPNKAGAEKVINYYYQPKQAAVVADYVNYVTPVHGAQAAMRTLDAPLAKNPLIFPPASTLARLHSFKNLAPAEEKVYEEMFQKVIGS